MYSLSSRNLGMVVLWALGCGGVFAAAQDLSDLPGPGGSQLIRDIATGEFSLGLSSRLGALIRPLTLDDPVWAARVLSIGSAAAAAVGAALMGTAIAGRRAGVWAGLLTAVWAPAACMGWSFGSGTIAWGLTWLGLGLCVYSSVHPRNIGVVLGALLAVCGTAVKSTAIPALVLLALSPMLARDGWRGRLRTLALVAVGAGVGWGIGVWGATTGEPFLLAPGSPSLARILPAAQGTSALDGIEGVFTLGQRGHPQGAFGVAACLALLGALVPGKRRIMRWVLLLLTLASMATVGVVTGPLLLPRYLVPTSMGLVVLCGAALHAWPQRPVLRNAWRGLGVVVLLVVTLDGIAFARAWSQLRQSYIAVADHRLPPVPAVLADRYARMSRGIVMESSHPSVLGLMAWIRSQPGVPLATIPFRDRRESHAHVAAIESGSPFSVLRPASCCSDSPDSRPCALDLMAAIDEGGIRMVIPEDPEGTSMKEQRFAAALSLAAGALELKRTAIDGFTIWTGRGSGGGAVCEVGRW